MTDVILIMKCYQVWMPYTQTLEAYMLGACYVCQADQNNMQLLPMSGYGRNIHNILAIDWESQENKAAVDASVSGLLKGCKCKAGCSTKRCSCRSKGPLVVIVSTAQIHRKKGMKTYSTYFENLAEVNDESTGVPDDANDIKDRVFGDENFEGDENFIDNEPSDSNIKCQCIIIIQFVLSMF